MIELKTFDNLNIVYIIISENITQNQLSTYFNNFKHVLSLNNNFFLIFDLRKAGFIPIQYIHDHAEFIQENEDVVNKLVNGTSIIVKNQVVKTVIKLLFSLRPPKRPCKIVNKLDEALTHLKEIGLPQECTL